MPLLAPHSSKPHYCILLVPGMALARYALAAPDRKLMRALCLLIATRAVVHKGLLGTWGYDVLMWYGQPTITAALVFAGCCWALRQSRLEARATRVSAAP